MDTWISRKYLKPWTRLQLGQKQARDLSSSLTALGLAPDTLEQLLLAICGGNGATWGLLSHKPWVSACTVYRMLLVMSAEVWGQWMRSCVADGLNSQLSYPWWEVTTTWLTRTKKRWLMKLIQRLSCTSSLPIRMSSQPAVRLTRDSSTRGTSILKCTRSISKEAR